MFPFKIWMVHRIQPCVMVRSFGILEDLTFVVFILVDIRFQIPCVNHSNSLANDFFCTLPACMMILLCKASVSLKSTIFFVEVCWSVVFPCTLCSYLYICVATRYMVLELGCRSVYTMISHV